MPKMIKKATLSVSVKIKIVKLSERLGKKLEHNARPCSLEYEDKDYNNTARESNQKKIKRELES